MGVCVKRVKEIVKHQDVDIDISKSFSDAVTLMAKNNLGVVVIVESQEVKGIITERDVMRFLNESIMLDTKLSYFCGRDIVTISSERTIDYALHILIDNNIRRLVVVDDKRHYLGVVTQEIIVSKLEEDIYKANITVSQITDNMQRKIYSLEPTDTIKKALNLMSEKNIGSILVMKDYTPVGIFTERDSIKIAANSLSLETKLEEIMSKPVVSVSENEIVSDVVALMDARSIRRVLVVDNSGKPSFVIGVRDIVRNIQGNYSKFLENKLKNTKDALNLLGEIIFEVYNDNKNYIINWANESAVRIFGKEIVENSADYLLKEHWEPILKRVTRDGLINDLEIELKERFFKVTAINHCIGKSDITLIVLKDITPHKRQISRLENEDKEKEKNIKLLQNIIDQQENLIILTDGYKILRANRAFREFCQTDDFEDCNISSLFISSKGLFVPKKGESSWIEQILKLPKIDRKVSIFDTKISEPKIFKVQISNLEDSTYVVTFIDITQSVFEMEKYRFYATHDLLTKLFNRAYLEDSIKHFIDMSHRYLGTLSILMLDLDHFKEINDTYGHQRGDEALKLFSHMIDSETRKSDIVARWGGEEFVILLPNTTSDKAELIAENLRKKCKELDFYDEKITVSIGVTGLRGSDTLETLMKRVDEALYQAKREGRDRVVTL
jgi:diguanylate cyclase (GGDEF)-like protein